MPRILVVLFFIGSSATVTSGCGTLVDEAFYVDAATLSELDIHRRERAAIQQDLPKTVPSKFAVTGHRISKGLGTIFAKRIYTTAGFIFVDAAEFEKLTVLIPEHFVEGPESVDVSDTNVIVYWSDGSSNFPGNSGCYGYAIGGKINFNQLDNGKIIANFQIEAKTRSPLNWKGECGKKTISGQFEFRRLEHKDITPWRGAAGGHIYDETIPQ